MKKQMRLNYFALVLAVLAATFTLSTFNARADTNDNPEIRVEIPVKALLTPQYGFEEKNNVQVVLWGVLMNSCYSLAESDIEKSPDGRTFLVKQYAYHETSGVCADESSMPEHMKMLIPFTQEVSIGRLPSGNYEFLYDMPGEVLGRRQMSVQPNVSPTVDTLPYAAVSAASAPDVINGPDQLKVKISGLLNSTCTSLDPNVGVLNENDVFVLLPTIKVKTGVICAQIMVPFETEVNLGKTFPGPHLIHVRSMNGRSVNKVVVVAK